MSIEQIHSDLPTHFFRSASEFESFLEREHTTSPGIYLKLAKKTSAIKSVAPAEAVELALCFGWIDGRANRIDDEWWTVRYTPRRPKSIWSQKNVCLIGKLASEGRMRPAGLAAVEAAKADGGWDRAYAGPATITVPDDLTAALAAEPDAASFFNGLNKADRYSVLWRLATTSPERRAARIESLVQSLAEGRTLRSAPKAAVKKPKHAADKKSKIWKTTISET